MTTLRQQQAGQRLALVAVEKNDVAGVGLLPDELLAQTDAVDFGDDLTALQRVPRTPPAIAAANESGRHRLVNPQISA
jgi:hypothetical protein